MITIDSEQLLEYITKEDVIDILVNHLGSAYPKKDKDNLLFQTICHNEEGGGRFKLHYFSDSKFFLCYTCCGTMSIYDLLMSVKGWDFKEAFNFLAKYKGIDAYKKHKGLKNIQDNNDLNFLNTHLYKTKKKQHLLPSYNKNILKIFDDFIPSSWITEDHISEEIMRYYDVKFYFNQYKGVIPHYDIEGNLVGIQSRNFLLHEEQKAKYIPITIQNLTYKYPTHFNLYGIYQNKNNIKKYKKAIIFESAKSVWLYGTYYGQENNISLASCGLVISNYQRDLLLNLGVEEVIIAWDKQYEIDKIHDKNSKEYKDFKRFIKAVKKACNVFLRYCEVSVIFDWEEDGIRLNYKDAPIDNGKEIYEELFKERYLIEDAEQLEELL